MINFNFSDRAKRELRESHIWYDAAKKSGIYSVDNAYADLGYEFRKEPGLVFPYYDMHGDPVTVIKDGEVVHYYRVLYLDNDTKWDHYQAVRTDDDDPNQEPYIQQVRRRDPTYEEALEMKKDLEQQGLTVKLIDKKDLNNVC